VRRGSQQARSSIIAIIGALLAGIALSACAPAPIAFDRRIREATFDRYWKDMRDHYPYFTLYGVDWEQQRTQRRDKALNADDPAEFYAQIAAMMSAVDDTHVRLETPASSNWRHDTTWSIDHPSIDLVSVARGLYVRRWPRGVHPRGPASGLAADAQFPRLVSVDGSPARLNLLLHLLRGEQDEPVTVTVEWADGSLESLPLNRKSDAVLINPDTRPKPLTVVHPGLMADTVMERGSEAVLEVPLEGADGSMSYMTIDAGRNDRSTAPADWLISRRFGDVGYISVSTVDFEDVGGLKAMMRSFDQAVDELIDTRAIILDLRYNGGGKPESMAAMTGRFLSRPTALESEYRHYLGIFPYRYVAEVPIRKPAYAGRLAVIVNGGTGSAAEHIAKLLQRSGRAVVVGDRTSGAEAVVRTVAGPDRSKLYFGAIVMTAYEGESFQHTGITPDVEVPITIERVRAEGYAQAVGSVERDQFIAACAAVEADGPAILDAAKKPPKPEPKPRPEAMPEAKPEPIPESTTPKE
jgi:C-terminal processing protease CtpA/Prc